MDVSHQAHESYIGRPALQLPTPALVLRKSALERNIELLHRDVERLGIAFRPHVKTLKSLEVTRMMLGAGKHGRIVASTLAEIAGCLPLVQEGILDECLYGLPIRPGALPYLSEISRSLTIVLMVDNEQHIQILEDFVKANPSTSPKQWNVFVKIDVGSSRAGMVNSSPSLPKLIERTESSPAVSLYGFYCHAGHSYSCRTSESAASVLQTEVEGVVAAASHLAKDREVVVSVGSTPTAHVVQSLKAALPANMKLELHAGNFPSNDLQQVATGLVNESQQALRVLAEVCSVYPDRNEALVNAGTVALSKETSDSPGYGRVTDKPDWSVVRMAQEHGILGLTTSEPEKKQQAVDAFKVGQKVFLYCQHACITAAAHFVYYVVDDDDVVRETWVPWKGW